MARIAHSYRPEAALGGAARGQVDGGEALPVDPAGHAAPARLLRLEQRHPATPEGAPITLLATRFSQCGFTLSYVCGNGSGSGMRSPLGAMSASRIDSHRLFAASNLRHIGCHVKFWCRPTFCRQTQNARSLPQLCGKLPSARYVNFEATFENFLPIGQSLPQKSSRHRENTRECVVMETAPP